MAFSILPIILIALSGLVKGLDVLGALKRLGFELLRFEKVLVEDLLLDAFICLEKQLMALKTANIYLLDLRQKVESGFGLCGNGFLDGLIPVVFLTDILLSLSTNKEQ